MRFFFIILSSSLLLFSLLACTNDKKEAGSDFSKKNDKLFTEVIDIHDEVMPKMDELVKLKKQLTHLAEKDHEKSALLRESIESLEKSDEAMMSWMREFNAEKARGTSEETTKYLQSELLKVTKMKTLFLESLEKARNLSSDTTIKN